MDNVITCEEDVKKVTDKQFVEKQKHLRMLESQLATKQGRQFVWWVLGKLLYDQAIMDTNSTIYRNAAKQEVGLSLKRELRSANREAFYLMEVENEPENKFKGAK